LCRLLRDEVAEALAEESDALTTLAADWRDLLFPQATDKQFADGYAQAVTFGPSSQTRLWADLNENARRPAPPRPRPTRVRGNSTAFEAYRAMGHYSGMDRSRTLALLGEHKPVLAERFGVTRLALFGSVARGTALPGSDIDWLVAFDGPATPDRYFGVQFYLEDLLGRAVDLVTERALRPQLRPYVERDAITIA
jgi:uncharacterized protein